MIDFFTSLVLFGSFYWGITILALFIIFCFIADINGNGFIATFALITMIATFYFWGKESLPTLKSLISVQNILIYFGLGLIHAIVRVYFFGRKHMEKVNKYRIEYKDKSHYNEPEIDYTEVKENVFRWWFLWFISLINWFISDMIRDIYNWCYQKLSKLFNFILELGMKSVKEVPIPNDKK